MEDILNRKTRLVDIKNKIKNGAFINTKYYGYFLVKNISDWKQASKEVS